jgi:hypothetical protein
MMSATVHPMAPAGISPALLEHSGQCDDLNTVCIDVGHIAALLALLCDSVPYAHLDPAERARWWQAAYLSRLLTAASAELVTMSEAASRTADEIAQQGGGK